MSKYDAEFAGLSDYALLGRVRQRLMCYRFTTSKRGRRANWRARAIEAMLYEAQEAMIDGREEPETSTEAKWQPRGRVFGHAPVSAEGGQILGPPIASTNQKPGTARYNQLRMAF